MTPVARLGALALASASVFGTGCEQEPHVTSLCLYENGLLLNGSCLTLCQSECALAGANHCAPPDCEASCDRTFAARTTACNDAAYVYWRCLRTSNGPEVRCENPEAVAFVAPNDECASEATAMSRACGECGFAIHSAADGGPRDGSTSDSGGKGIRDSGSPDRANPAPARE